MWQNCNKFATRYVQNNSFIAGKDARVAEEARLESV